MISAAELNGIYQAELAALAQEPVNGNPSAVSLRHMLAETRRRPPGALKPDRPTWVWSDLHLHHRNIIRYTERPFASCEQMDGFLHGACSGRPWATTSTCSPAATSPWPGA